MAASLDQWLTTHLGRTITYTHAFKYPNFASMYPPIECSGELSTRLHRHFAGTGESASILITPPAKDVHLLSVTEDAAEYLTYPGMPHEGRARITANGPGKD